MDDFLTESEDATMEGQFSSVVAAMILYNSFSGDPLTTEDDLSVKECELLQ
jgi:hypothetical protein